MDDKVVYIDSNQEEVVSLLQEALDKAKNGHYKYLAVVGVHDEGELDFTAVGVLDSVDDALKVTGVFGYLSNTLYNNIGMETEFEYEAPQV